MREIRKSGSEGGARQTNVSFLPLSVEKFFPRLCVSVRGLPCRRCGGPPSFLGIHRCCIREEGVCEVFG